MIFVLKTAVSIDSVIPSRLLFDFGELSSLFDSEIVF